MKHRSAQSQLHLAEIRARAGLVSARTALVNAARGLVKSYGERLRKCATEQFRWETTSGLNAGLREALEPLLREIESLNERIKEYYRHVSGNGGTQTGEGCRRKEGDEYLRTLLVQGAHYILGPFGEDRDLRRWGLKLSARGGKNA